MPESSNMTDSDAFKTQLRLIVSDLANAVMADIFSAAEKVSRNPETEEKLHSVVNSLCVQAVHKILKAVREAAVSPPLPEGAEDPAGGRGDPGGAEEISAGPEQRSEGLGMSTDDEAWRRPPAERTCLVVLTSAAADPESLLMGRHTNANASGETPSLLGSSLCDVPDHNYAHPPSLLASAPSAEEGRVSVACGRKRWRGHLKIVSTAPQEAEHHLLCSRCGMLFPNSERLDDHERKCHPPCSVCGVLLTGVLRLREHEIKEHGLLPYACDYCTKRFNHKAHRDAHVKARHTGEKTCHCDICGKGYSCISVLKTHRMTHFDKTFICSVCGKGFYHAYHLTRHKLVHLDERPHQCATCGRGFTQASNLRSHQASHSGERQLCSVCGKSYRCLRNHVISKHSHELPLHELPASNSIAACQVCGRKFPNMSQLRVHQRSHTGEKPFHCDICGKGYRVKELLRDHRYTHSGEKPYRCSLCSKSFNMAASFLRHRSVHSGETPHSCYDCGKHFRLVAFLKAHLQTRAHLKRVEQRRTAATDV